MMKLIVALFLLFSMSSFGQSKTPISVIDFIKIKNDKRAETIFYYENNWKIFRDSALKQHYITSYKMLTTKADSSANFDLMLITEYADSLNLKLSEERFLQIIKALRPNGLKLLNDLKPNDFRQMLFSREAEAVFYSDVQ